MIIDDQEREIGRLREKLADVYAGGLAHTSDCAVSCAPAMEPGPCDCGASLRNKELAA